VIVGKDRMGTGDPRPHLLFLCHRIPYPPDKGDKIRSYHWLRALAESFQVHLVAFVDDPADWVYRRQVERSCATCSLFPLRPRAARVRSLVGLLTGEPLTLPYYRDPRIKRRLKELSETRRITHVFVYSSAMAQYAMHAPLEAARRVIDFVDADSDKWRQYASGLRGPIRWIYSREARRLEIADQTVAGTFDASVFVSAAEATWFRHRVNLPDDRVTSVNNGVDTSYFDPDRDYESPYPAGQRPVVFTGAMDYWANVDAVTWFTRDVWPRVCALDPHAVFYIVGARPTAVVRALTAERVVVTGRVPDIRPYLRHAAAVVAPMRIARGVQNKVLEAMSMAHAPVVTSKALEGIGAVDGRELLVADDALQLARQVLRVLNGSNAALEPAARDFVRKHHSWHESCERLVRLVAGAEKTDVPNVIARRYAN